MINEFYEKAHTVSRENSKVIHLRLTFHIDI